MVGFEHRLSALAPTPLLGKLQGGNSLLAYTRERLIFLGDDEDRFIERNLIRRVYTPEAGRLGFLDSQGVLLLLIASSAFQPEALRTFLHSMAANQPYGLDDTQSQNPIPVTESSLQTDPTPANPNISPPTTSPSPIPSWLPTDAGNPPASAEPIPSWVKSPQVTQALPPPEPVPPTHESPVEQVVRPSRWMLIYRGLALLVVVLGFLAAVDIQTALVAPALQVWIALASLSLGVILWRSNPS